MALSASNLSQLTQSNDFKLWVYTSISDNIAAINSAGYFNDAANMPCVRDLMIVGDTATPTTNFVTFLSNTGSVVNVFNGTAIAKPIATSAARTTCRSLPTLLLTKTVAKRNLDTKIVLVILKKIAHILVAPY